MAFFNDDGTEVNPSELIIPQKCIQCKLYTPVNIAEDDSTPPSIEWETNLFCILTRMDNMDNEQEFICRDYVFNPDWKTRIN